MTARRSLVLAALTAAAAFAAAWAEFMMAPRFEW